MEFVMTVNLSGMYQNMKGGISFLPTEKKVKISVVQGRSCLLCGGENGRDQGG